MLDTATCIYLINRYPRIRRKASPTQCAISVIVLGELERAACLSDYNASLILDFTKRINVVALDHDTAYAYADMHLYLESEGRTIPPNALWTAAHASVLGLTLVTSDTQALCRIPQLSVTTWLDE